MLQPWNNLFLVAILIWMQTGFAMVLFSAALKGVPEDMLEAARIDGAGEIRIFRSIIIPAISGTILSVSTTIVVFTLKIFDVVMVMTGGQYDTEVVATQFYRQFFMYRNAGYGSTLAIVLLIAVIPVIIINLRQFRKQGDSDEANKEKDDVENNRQRRTRFYLPHLAHPDGRPLGLLLPACG